MKPLSFVYFFWNEAIKHVSTFFLKLGQIPSRNETSVRGYLSENMFFPAKSFYPRFVRYELRC